MAVVASSSSSISFHPSNARIPLPRRRALSPNNPSFLRLSPAGVAVRRASSTLPLSWDSKPDDSHFNGWDSYLTEPPQRNGKEGFGVYLIGAVGASIVVFVAAMARFSHRRGFKIQRPGYFRTGVKLTRSTEEPETSLLNVQEDSAPDGSVESVVHEVGDNVLPDVSRPRDRTECIIIPPLVDSTQHEAMMILKRLKIIEDGIKVDELCTRREYARWLVRMNSLLERNMKWKIIPSISLLGYRMSAFDDVNIEDRDFEAIQGIYHGKIL